MHSVKEDRKRGEEKGGDGEEISEGLRNGSKLLSWFGKMKGHEETSGDRLDEMRSLRATDGTLMQGLLQKKGERKGDAFLQRWVSLDREGLSYMVGEGEPVLDRIAFSDVVAICWHRADTGCEGKDNAVLTLHDQGDELKESSDTLAFHDHSKAFDGQKTWLRVNIILREDIYEDCISQVTDLELNSTDFAIVTHKQAYQRGRVFLLRADNREKAEQWYSTLARVLSSWAGKPVVKVSTFSRIRRSVRWFYLGDRCQIFVAALILSNFVTNIFDKHFMPEPGSSTEAIFTDVDTVFTIVFTVELATNMFATLVWDFFRDAWNWFDMVVVLVSLMSMALTNLPGANVLRLMRCFRVFRLFKRIPSLRQIVVALTASVPPMINAFALVCLVSAIYAIVGVTFFSKHSPENFFDFFTSMFTMFQVMTGDNWSDICRDLFEITGEGAIVALYFVSFQLIVALVLVNVVIAVLLDEFSKAADRRESAADGQNDDDGLRCPFEKVAIYLADYRDLDDLESMIHDLFDRILFRASLKCNFGFASISDTAESIRRTLKFFFKIWQTGEVDYALMNDGRVGYAEFRDGVKTLGFVPPIIVTHETWADYVLAQAEMLRVDPDDQLLGRPGFVALMKQALKRYQLRTLNSAMESMPDAWNKQSITAVLLGVKGLLVEDLELAKGDLSFISDKTRDETACYVETSDEVERAATELLLKRLVTDMHKMHKRFDAVESDLSAINDLKARTGKPSGHLIAPSGPGEPQDGFDGGTKDGQSGATALISKQALAKRNELGTEGKEPMANWGLGALTSPLSFDPSTMPSLTDPGSIFLQGNDAANNLFGGVMGGLSSIGESTAVMMPKMPELPEGMQISFPVLGAATMKEAE